MLSLVNRLQILPYDCPTIAQTGDVTGTTPADVVMANPTLKIVGGSNDGKILSRSAGEFSVTGIDNLGRVSLTISFVFGAGGVVQWTDAPAGYEIVQIDSTTYRLQRALTLQIQGGWEDGVLLSWKARTNLLTNSQSFTGTWTAYRGSVIAAAATAPDGTLTGPKFKEDTTASASHLIGQNQTAHPNVPLTLSVYVAPSGRNDMQLRFSTASAGTSRYCNLGTKAIGGTTTWGTGFTTATGVATSNLNGYGRYSITATQSNNDIVSVQILASDATPNVSYSGDGTSGILPWNAMLEEGITAGRYIPTGANPVTETDYTLSLDAAGNLIITLARALEATANLAWTNAPADMEIVKLDSLNYRIQRKVRVGIAGSWEDGVELSPKVRVSQALNSDTPASWSVKTGVTPSGNTIMETTANSQHVVGIQTSFVAGTNTVAVRVRPIGRMRFYLVSNASGAWKGCLFNLTSSTVSPETGWSNATIATLSDGSYLLSATVTAAASGTFTIQCHSADDASAITFVGDVAKGFELLRLFVTPGSAVGGRLFACGASTTTKQDYVWGPVRADGTCLLTLTDPLASGAVLRTLEIPSGWELVPESATVYRLQRAVGVSIVGSWENGTVLSAAKREQRLLQSDSIWASPWGSTGLASAAASSAVLTPGGAQTCKLVEDTATTWHNRRQDVTVAAGEYALLYAVVRSGERTALVLDTSGWPALFGGSNPVRVFADLTTGAPSSAPATATVGSASLGSGWWLVWIRSKAPASRSGALSAILGLVAGGNTNYLGDGVSGLYVARAGAVVGANVPDTPLGMWHIVTTTAPFTGPDYTWSSQQGDGSYTLTLRDPLASGGDLAFTLPSGATITKTLATTWKYVPGKVVQDSQIVMLGANGRYFDSDLSKGRSIWQTVSGIVASKDYTFRALIYVEGVPSYGTSGLFRCVLSGDSPVYGTATWTATGIPGLWLLKVTGIQTALSSKSFGVYRAPAQSDTRAFTILCWTLCDGTTDGRLLPGAANQPDATVSDGVLSLTRPLMGGATLQWVP